MSLSKLRDSCRHRHQDSQPGEPASPCSSLSLSSSISSAVTHLPNSFASLQSSAATVEAHSIDSHHMAQDQAQQIVLDDADAVSAGSQTSTCSAKMTLPLEQERPASRLPPALNIPR